MAESSTVLTKRDGVIIITDGTRSYVVSGEVGDVSVTEASAEVTQFLDRGVMGGAGFARRADEAPVELSFSAYLRGTLDSASDVSLPGLLMWARGDSASDAGLAEIVADGWASTATQPDGLRTVHVDWFPAGNATGAKGFRCADAVISGEYSEGDPNSIAVTARSLTAAKLARVVAP